MSLALIHAPAAAEAIDDRTRLERAVLARLEKYSQRAGGYLEALDPYNGEIDEVQAVDDIIRALRGRTPGVLVLVGTCTYENVSVRKAQLRAEYRIEILCSSKHWRTDAARNSGDVASQGTAQADPGINRILYDVRTALYGRRLGIAGAGRPVPVLEQVVVQAPELTAWNAIYEIKMRIGQDPESAGAPVPASSVLHRHNLEDSAAVNPVTQGETDAQ